MSALMMLAAPFRMVMAWILNRTGSLFLVGLAHAAGNAVVNGRQLGLDTVPPPTPTSGLSKGGLRHGT